MYQHPSISICQTCQHVMPWSQTNYGVQPAWCPQCHTTRPHDIKPSDTPCAPVAADYHPKPASECEARGTECKGNPCVYCGKGTNQSEFVSVVKQSQPDLFHE